MRNAMFAGVLVSILSVVAFFSGRIGAVADDAKAPPATQPTSRPVNQFCPIMADSKIDPTVTYVYKGKVYGFCCADCIDDFKKNPEKYKDAK